MVKPPDELLELLVPAHFGPPSEEYRHTIARAAFFTALLQDREGDFDGILDRWPVRVRRGNTLARWIQNEAEAFTRRLGCPWPWLTLAVERYLSLIYLVWQRKPLPRPLVTKVPESALRAIYGDGRRAPKDGGRELADWGRWYYQVCVKGRSIRRIAQERHTEKKHEEILRKSFKDCDCRKAVKHGLAEAARLIDSPEVPPLAPLGN